MTNSNPDLRPLQYLKNTKILALDTETTGLRPYHGDRPFCITISDAEKDYYFEPKRDKLWPKVISWDDESLNAFQEFFKVPRTYYLQNAKFDLHMLYSVGLKIPPESKIIDTMSLARILYNQEEALNLDHLAKKYLNIPKDESVMKYITDNSLFEDIDVPLLKKSVRRLRFQDVPSEILIPYAKKDTRLTFDLADKLLIKIENESNIKLPEGKSLNQIVDNEASVLKVVFEMEKNGVKVDPEYSKKAIAYNETIMNDAIQFLQKTTGEDYKASNKFMENAFQKTGYDMSKFGFTSKGNFCFNKEALDKVEHPIAKAVNQYRKAKANINFFAGFLYHRDSEDIIHPDFHPEGAKTGRFSCSNPNLQNLKKAEEDEILDDSEAPVRKAIVPYDKDHCLFMVDYDQQEYRLLLDYSNEAELIEMVKGGLDVHQATADIIGVDRKQAKTLNFGILYGMGIDALATKLGVTFNEARLFRENFYSKLPKTTEFIKKVRDTARSRGYVFNWFSRLLRFPDPNKSYQALNHLIQSGCADITKVALIKLQAYFDEMKLRSKISLVIHDEVLFNMHKSELDHCEKILKIMEEVYPYKHLNLTCSPSYSWSNWNDKSKGYPFKVPF